MDVFVILFCRVDQFGTPVIRDCMSQGFMRTIVSIYESTSGNCEAEDIWQSMDA